MTPERLISDTYAYFLGHGYWPMVRYVQGEYGPRINVRAIAAELGRHTIVCQDGADGRCFLTLEGLARIPEATTDLNNLARAVAFIGQQIGTESPTEIDSSRIGTALELEGVALARVGALLYQVSRLWSGGSWPPDNVGFKITPTEQALFFRDIQSFKELEEARAQVERDDRRIGELLSRAYSRAHGASSPSVEGDGPSRYTLANSRLDVVLQSDLLELATVRSLGAWKSAAILAGTCVEALLLDLCQRHHDMCSARWGENWARNVGTDKMARFAKENGWITTDHLELIGPIRRWRNLVHPFSAATTTEPTKELADALIAVLYLLMADLVRSEAD